MLDRQRMNFKSECPVVIKLVRGRKHCFIPLAQKVKWEDWNFKKSLLNEKRGTVEEEIERQKCNFYIESEVLKVKKILLDFTVMGKEYTLEDVIKSYRHVSSGVYVYDYIRDIADSLEKLGKNGNSNVYRGTMGVLQHFNKKQDLTFEEVNYSFIKNFEIYLQQKGCKVNTVSIYLRTIRSVYNRAIRDGIVAEEYYPFKKITIRKEKTMKRAIYKEEIAAIRKLNIAASPRLELARDIFLFSFYMRGMSFKDIAFLKVSNILGDRLYYSRQKTAQKLNIKITEKAREIICKYNDLSDRMSYIFPLIQYPGKNEYHQYKNAYREVNRRLKLIGNTLHFHFPLTTYVARHSWASIAKRSGIPIAVISEGLGHDSEKTTQIYLDSFENNVLDAANEIITDF